MARVCRTCSAPIYRGNQSGLCRSCAQSDPEIIARRRAGFKRTYALNPELKAERSRRAKEQMACPEARAALSERAKRQRLWELGTPAAHTPECNALRGRRESETKWAWCPPEHREMARALMRKHGARAADVRRVVLEHHEAEMARFRRKVLEGAQ